MQSAAVASSVPVVKPNSQNSTIQIAAATASLAPVVQLDVPDFKTPEGLVHNNQVSGAAAVASSAKPVSQDYKDQGNMGYGAAAAPAVKQKGSTGIGNIFRPAFEWPSYTPALKSLELVHSYPEKLKSSKAEMAVL